ncbi:MAG: glutamine synthetase III [Acidobacteria bacterium]|nr:glutamine synthetase III [Acidobacteriota bacterium]MBI3655693.1 glutamine synthetase III [Acidobacteriota bacterium]
MTAKGYAGAAARRWAVAEVSRRKVRSCNLPLDTEGRPLTVAEMYGMNTFNQRAMKEKLPKEVYHKLQQTIRHGKKLDISIANTVAHAIKEWAIEKGATHFCHWFQPQTGLTAEKHDAFLSFDEEGTPIERFSGSQLIQSEPDASSFPSGGMRATFEARGYTAWDPSSPAFIMEATNGKTLCIPSVFIAYHGQALDQKAPLLRSMEFLNKKALELLHLFGHGTATRVVPTVGPEQEYFLIDKAFYYLRPDLLLAGRTLVGARPPKGQELEDHYFGSIKDRFLACMQEAEIELYKLGIPVKTRHNEVAPNQFELAPIFEEANVASDHNQLVMETLRAVAFRHDLALLLHEKPFAGVNGSGKHNNWSMQDSDGNNLLDPGKTPDENLQFLAVLGAVLRGVNRHAGLLRAAVAGAGNDHRLGANEAPPAIISVFLGEQLHRILDLIEAGGITRETSEQQIIDLGIAKLPEIAKDYTDRNRTSPFAFTGNKFEFRAVASSASIASPMAVLNGVVAEALGEVTDAIRARTAKGTEFKTAVMEVIREVIKETKKVRFEGNNYAPEWVAAAEHRGLPNLRKTPEALAELITPTAKKFFAASGIFSQEELEARYHVRLERYNKDIEIEIEAMKEIAKTLVLPAGFQQQGLLADAIKNLMALEKSSGTSVAFNSGPQLQQLKTISDLISKLITDLEAFESSSAKAVAEEDIQKKARAFADQIVPAMADLRATCDRMEEAIADEFWPLPKYREMLFLT